MMSIVSFRCVVHYFSVLLIYSFIACLSIYKLSNRYTVAVLYTQDQIIKRSQQFDVCRSISGYC